MTILVMRVVQTARSPPPNGPRSSTCRNGAWPLSNKAPPRPFQPEFSASRTT